MGIEETEILIIIPGIPAELNKNDLRNETAINIRYPLDDPNKSVEINMGMSEKSNVIIGTPGMIFK